MKYQESSLKHDLSYFTLKDMSECSSTLRNIGADAKSMEETANRVTRYLYDNMINMQTGERTCALVRFFKTHSYIDLDDELRQFADKFFSSNIEGPQVKCLTLLATTGDSPEWNSRHSSGGHKAIPLLSEEVVNKVPMIRNLIRQTGLDINTVIKPDPELLLDMAQKSFNVFHVPNAVESPYIPAQENFVVPFGIKSVIGFGGMLPCGDMFVIIIFSKVPISKQTAEMFKSITLNIKLAVMPFEQKVFA